MLSRQLVRTGAASHINPDALVELGGISSDVLSAMKHLLAEGIVAAGLVLVKALKALLMGLAAHWAQDHVVQDLKLSKESTNDGEQQANETCHGEHLSWG